MKAMVVALVLAVVIAKAMGMIGGLSDLDVKVGYAAISLAVGTGIISLIFYLLKEEPVEERKRTYKRCIPMPEDLYFRNRRG